MAFDITPYVDMSPKKVRELIRKGVIDFPTAGMCRGYAQANMDAGVSAGSFCLGLCGRRKVAEGLEY